MASVGETEESGSSDCGHIEDRWSGGRSRRGTRRQFGGDL